ISTPETPCLVACALTLAASLIEHEPVPGIMRAVGTPAATTLSRSVMRSSADIELASELVPNMASPQSWLISHLQWAMKRPTSGDRSRLKGVTTGERTPLIRAATMIIFLPGMAHLFCNEAPETSSARNTSGRWLCRHPDRPRQYVRRYF